MMATRTYRSIWSGIPGSHYVFVARRADKPTGSGYVNAEGVVGGSFSEGIHMHRAIGLTYPTWGQFVCDLKIDLQEPEGWFEVYFSGIGESGGPGVIPLPALTLFHDPVGLRSPEGFPLRFVTPPERAFVVTEIPPPGPIPPPS